LNTLRQRLLDWGSWLYTRRWFPLLVFLLIAAMLVAGNLIVRRCQEQGVAFYACGTGG